jgi:glycerophosphoryl diester phosphodiesterase
MPELTRTAPLRRVGHKGADLIAPGNTRESFDAALAAGVDMIEFDVLPVRWPGEADTPLVLAHDFEHPLEHAMTLDEGLAHLAAEAFVGVELDVDLKLPGYEERVVEALRTHGLVERTLISSQYMRSLVRIRALEPRLRLGWSVPRARRDYTKSWLWLLPALSALALMRHRLPGLASGHLGARRVDAVMAHERLATPALVRSVHAAGGELYVWTVDDAAKIRRLEAMGVDAVITNDPRLFEPLTPRSGTSPR